MSIMFSHRMSYFVGNTFLSGKKADKKTGRYTLLRFAMLKNNILTHTVVFKMNTFLLKQAFVY